jgi:hypothetical protein
MQNVKVSVKQNKVNAETHGRGIDGATWYLGTPEKIETFKSGDFCFDDENFDIYRCEKGEWVLLCNLNNLHLIYELCEKYKIMLQELVDNAKEHPSYREWWFGTREEYNSLTQDERNEKLIYFIEEGT